MKYFYKSKADSNFRRKIVTVIGPNIQKCFLAYYLDDDISQPLSLPPHGNSKLNTNPYIRIEKSTLEKVIL